MTTRYKTIKKMSEVPEAFRNIVSFQSIDDKVEAVILKLEGQEMRISYANTYSNALSICSLAGKEKVTKHTITGKFMGLVEVNEVFDDYSEASERLSEYTAKAGYSDSGLTLSEIEVEQESEKI